MDLKQSIANFIVGYYNALVNEMSMWDTVKVDIVDIALPEIEIVPLGNYGIYEYSGAVPLSILPLTVDAIHIGNPDYSNTVDYGYTLAETKTTSASFEWGLSKELTLGTEVEGNINLPLVAEGKVNFSATEKIGSHKTWHEETIQSWAMTHQVLYKIPPRKILNVSVMVNQAQFNDVDFKMRLKISGTTTIAAKLTFHDDEWDMDTPFHEPVAYSIKFSDMVSQRPDLFSVCSIEDADTVIIDANGKFRGVFGTDIDIVPTYSDYNTVISGLGMNPGSPTTNKKIKDRLAIESIKSGIHDPVTGKAKPRDISKAKADMKRIVEYINTKAAIKRAQEPTVVTPIIG